jgi:hypothetical protein
VLKINGEVVLNFLLHNRKTKDPTVNSNRRVNEVWGESIAVVVKALRDFISFPPN